MHNSNLLRNQLPVTLFAHLILRLVLELSLSQSQHWLTSLPYTLSLTDLQDQHSIAHISQTSIAQYFCVPSFLHPCVKGICIYQILLSPYKKSKAIIKLFLTPPSSVLKETKLGQTKTYCTWCIIQPVCQTKGYREKAVLNVNCHQHLILHNGWCQLSLFYFAVHFVLHRYRAFNAYLPSTASRALLPAWGVNNSAYIFVLNQCTIHHIIKRKIELLKTCDNNCIKTLLPLTFSTLCFITT